MNDFDIATFKIFQFTVIITAWKLVGYTGALMFAGRWFIQMAASTKKGKPVLPIAFWYMSMAGSVLMLLYFIFGKNDSVGILNNLFPTAVAFYNLYLEHTGRSRAKRAAAEASEE